MKLSPSIKEMIEMKVERAWELVEPHIEFTEEENEVNMLLWEVLHYTNELDKKRDEYKEKLDGKILENDALIRRLKEAEGENALPEISEDWDPFAEDEDDNPFEEDGLIKPLKLDDEDDDPWKIDAVEFDKEIKKLPKRGRKKKS